MIRFEKVTPDNFEGVINLKLRDDQVGFLENNLYSLAESKVFDYLEPRAIYADDTLIGFMLYYFQPDGVTRQMGPGEGKHEIHSGGQDYIYFKRLMLDQSFQGKGLGRAAMTAALAFFKEEYPSAAFVELMHYMDNDTGASLYESVGFASTGEVRRTLRPGTEDEYDEELVRRMYY
ncbi:MAG: GNAT family N-acetyltransferase [Firmicutes bacterium]|nr:GNAT family N-acetyltransferase [Bacillota bacterium]